MKIYSCHTPSHEVLYRRYFLPSLPPQFKNHSTRQNIVGSGDFLARDFLQSIEAKIELVLESIAANRGEAIIWSDVDIIFFGDPSALLAKLLAEEETDIWFQKENIGESEEVNVGLVLMRCNAAVEKLYRDALTIMRSNPGFNDQEAINQLFRNGAAVGLDYLPLQFAARSHGWPPERNILAYHANCTAGIDGVGQKIRQFTELMWIRRFGVRSWKLRVKVMRLMHKFKTLI